MSKPRIFPAQWQLAVRTLQSVVSDGRAADRLLQTAFAAQRAMGGRDRRRVTELVYGTLRDLRRLQCVAASRAPEDVCAVHALESGASDVDGLQRLGLAQALTLAQRLETFDPKGLSDAQRLNLPDALYAIWCAEIGSAETGALAAALQQQAPVDLRVNTLKATPTQVIDALDAANIAAAPCPHAPHGLRLAGRAPLQALPAFRDGWIEPQDEGSQLLAMLVDAQPGERIADWCAGAGGKALALAAAMHDRGELWAMDTDAQRLQRLLPRLQRAGARSVRMQTPDDDMSPGEFDAVLVDAPCSATGTWRRQPEARLKALDLGALAATQRQILDSASRSVRPGGRLIYGTCSLLDAENAAVVEGFLGNHPEFEAVDAGAVLAAQGVRLPGRYLRLWPHRHGTDGFFGACLRRRG